MAATGRRSTRQSAQTPAVDDPLAPPPDSEDGEPVAEVAVASLTPPPPAAPIDPPATATPGPDPAEATRPDAPPAIELDWDKALDPSVIGLAMANANRSELIVDSITGKPPVGDEEIAALFEKATEAGTNRILTRRLSVIRRLGSSTHTGRCLFMVDGTVLSYEQYRDLQARLNEQRL